MIKRIGHAGLSIIIGKQSDILLKGFSEFKRWLDEIFRYLPGGNVIKYRQQAEMAYMAMHGWKDLSRNPWFYQP